MAKYASKVINVAKSDIGYEEKKSNKSLNSKHANAGSNNYTKYGAWMNMNGVYWCAQAISYWFYKAYGNSGAKDLLLGSPSASCEVIRQRFVKEKRYSDKPKKGSLIFFKGSRHSGANHIGIVIHVSDNTVTTVEGNTSSDSYNDNGGCVASHVYARSNSRILGYGAPKYDSESAVNTKSSVSTVTARINAKSGLRLRAEASLKSKIILVIPYSQKVEVLKKGSTWCKVRYKKKTGYVARKYLKF